MKNCYATKIENRLAIADLTDYYDKGMLITRINVPKAFRGQGYGSRLLSQIIKDADADKVTLWLEIQPSDGLDYEQLRDWYERYGFKFTGGIYKRRFAGAKNYQT